MPLGWTFRIILPLFLLKKDAFSPLSLKLQFIYLPYENFHQFPHPTLVKSSNKMVFWLLVPGRFKNPSSLSLGSDKDDENGYWLMVSGYWLMVMVRVMVMVTGYWLMVMVMLVFSVIVKNITFWKWIFDYAHVYMNKWLNDGRRTRAPPRRGEEGWDGWYPGYKH